MNQNKIYKKVIVSILGLCVLFYPLYLGLAAQAIDPYQDSDLNRARSGMLSSGAESLKSSAMPYVYNVATEDPVAIVNHPDNFSGLVTELPQKVSSVAGVIKESTSTEKPKSVPPGLGEFALRVSDLSFVKLGPKYYELTYQGKSYKSNERNWVRLSDTLSLKVNFNQDRQIESIEVLNYYDPADRTAASHSLLELDCLGVNQEWEVSKVKAWGDKVPYVAGINFMIDYTNGVIRYGNQNSEFLMVVRPADVAELRYDYFKGVLPTLLKDEILPKIETKFFISASYRDGVLLNINHRGEAGEKYQQLMTGENDFKDLDLTAIPRTTEGILQNLQDDCLIRLGLWQDVEGFRYMPYAVMTQDQEIQFLIDDEHHSAYSRSQQDGSMRLTVNGKKYRIEFAEGGICRLERDWVEGGMKVLDQNGDGNIVVDETFATIKSFTAVYGLSRDMAAFDSRYDFNEDGRIDAADWKILKAIFKRTGFGVMQKAWEALDPQGTFGISTQQAVKTLLSMNLSLDKSEGDPGYDGRFDFDENNSVNISDWAVLLQMLIVSGHMPIVRVFKTVDQDMDIGISTSEALGAYAAILNDMANPAKDRNVVSGYDFDANGRIDLDDWEYLASVMQTAGSKTLSDPDGNGKVTLADLKIIRGVLARTLSVDDLPLTLGDMNMDRRVDDSDAIALMEFLVALKKGEQVQILPSQFFLADLDQDRELTFADARLISAVASGLIAAEDLPVKLGDINRDGNVQIGDDSLVSQYLNGMSMGQAGDLTPLQLYLADIDGDAKVTYSDLRVIAGIIAGIVRTDELPLKLGDVSGDGVIQKDDCRILFEMLTSAAQQSADPSTVLKKYLADINGDGMVTRDDALIMLSVVLGMKTLDVSPALTIEEKMMVSSYADMDRDKDIQISSEEALQFLNEFSQSFGKKSGGLGYEWRFDINQDQTVDLKDWELAEKTLILSGHEALARGWRAMDGNRDMQISSDEMIDTLKRFALHFNKKPSEDGYDLCFDSNGDKKVDFEDWPFVARLLQLRGETVTFATEKTIDGVAIRSYTIERKVISRMYGELIQQKILRMANQQLYKSGERLVKMLPDKSVNVQETQRSYHVTGRLLSESIIRTTDEGLQFSLQRDYDSLGDIASSYVSVYQTGKGVRFKGQVEIVSLLNEEGTGLLTQIKGNLDYNNPLTINILKDKIETIVRNK